MKTFNYKIFGLFLFIVLTWGMAWPVNKIGLQFMSPLWYTALRLVVGTATMMGLVIALKKFAFPKREDIWLILIIGLLQISIYILLANIGLTYLPAGRSSLIAYTTPLWVMPITALFFKEETAWLKWLGFFLGIGGLILLLSPWEMNWKDYKIIYGSAMLLLASLCWAVSMFCVRYMKWNKSPLELIPWQLLIGTLPVLALAWFKEPLLTIKWNEPLVLSLLYNGVLVTGLSYWCGVIINRALPTLLVSLGMLVIPVFSLTVSALFMHEAIQVPTIMATGMIFLGLACVAL